MSDTDINATVNVTEDIYADVDSTAMSAAVIDDGDSIVVPAEVDFGHTLDTELEDNDLIDVPVDESVGIAGDHRVLIHRDAPNQHPMGAITGLNDALAGINTALSSRISQVEAETAELDVDMAGALLRIGDLQNQVDGNITTWFYAAAPAMNLPPVTLDPSNPHDTGWDTDDKKNEHKGDLYYNTITGYAYRFAYTDGAYGWLRITDTDVVKALADAAHAQDTADSKRRVFYTTPYPPYDKGDLWVQGGGGDILVCTTEKPADGSYSASDWSMASKYTDDTVADIALASANGKNTVYHQASQPTGGTYKKGDTWFDTDDDYTMYTYDGSLWIKEQFGNGAIQDLSINNAKIQNATIEYEKIKSVDAGKITVGYLNAARIESGSIGVGKIDATSGTFNTANIPVLDASKIQANTISVSSLSDGANYSTTTQMNTAIGNAVDGIEVGGRNLARNTNIYKTTSLTWATLGGTICNDIAEGETVTISVEVDAKNVAWESSGSCRIGCEFSIAKSGGGYQYIGAWAGKTVSPTSNVVEAFTGDFHKRVSKTFTLAGSISKSDEVGIYLYIQNVSSGTVSVGKIQIERGNKASDWSTAPEDVQAEIDAKKSTFTINATGTDASQGYAQILAWAEEGRQLTWAVDSTAGIKVGDTVRIKTTVANMSNAPVYVVTTCRETPTSSTSIKTASHGLDTTIIDGGNILTNSIGANQIAANAISASELDTDNINNSGLLTTGALTVGARNDVLNSNIQIGGVNLIPLSRNLKSFSNESTNFVALTYTNVDCYMEVTASTTYRYGIYYDVNVSANTTYTLSHRASSVTGTISLGVGNRTGSASAWNDIVPYKGLVNGENVTTFTTPSGVTKIRIYFGGTNGAHCYIWKLKLELGNKASDWTAAPEDTASVKYLTSGYSGAYATYVRWVSDYASDTYNVTSSSGVNVGDIVLIEVACTTTNKSLYIQGRVTAIPSDTQVTIAPMGLVDKADYASKSATSYITHIDDNGIRVHPSSTENNSAVINASGLEVFKGGTAAANSVAFYGDTARVGKSSTRHIEIKDGGMQVYEDSTTVMGHFGYGQGNNRSNGTSTAPYFTLGKRGTTITAVGNYSVAEGDCAIASGYSSHAEGSWVYINTAGSYGSAGTYYPTASDVAAHAEGEGTLASESAAHAEGVLTVASGYASHAEGNATIASTSGAHAEGIKTSASGTNGSHAEGFTTVASGEHAHAEGAFTTASGDSSHAGGYRTTATRNYQTVIGKYNRLTGSGTAADPYVATNAAFIVGGGVTTTGKDLLTVDWSGNTVIAGTLTQSSDRRLKEHISYVGDEAIEFIDGLKPAHYIKDGEKHLGFYAQDVAEVDKWDCIIGEEMNGYMTLGYMELLAPMVAYIQRLEKRIEELERSK